MLIGYGETQMAVYRNQPLLCVGIVKFLMSLFLIMYGHLSPHKRSKSDWLMGGTDALWWGRPPM